MKLAILAVLTTLMGLGFTAPAALESKLDITLRNVLAGPAIIPASCDECREHRELCLKYGVGDSDSGCNKVCTSYICRKWDCRNCGQDFNCDDANLSMPPGWE